MELDTRKPRFSVFEQFRWFWKEVETLREVVLAPAMAPSAAPAGEALAPVPVSVRERLIGALRAQEAEFSHRTSGAALSGYREAQYVMAALADEVFLHLAWSGAARWATRLIETEQFGTRCAGQEVFARIDRLLERADPEDVELGAVYLTALALGFRGRYGNRPDGGAIDRYTALLFRFIFAKNPDLAQPFRKLMPSCYESTIPAGAGKKLRGPRVWWWVAASVVLVWLVASHALWRGVTTPLHAQIENILSKTPQLEHVK
jgi:type VI secretion system protein ImpK